MPVTIKDIASKAGVSHATVSRALNGNPAISEKTANGIRDLALEMGYLPSAAARGLKTSRSQVLGVIVSRIDNPYFGEILQGIEDALHGTGFSIFVASTNQDPGKEKAILQVLGEQRVDGIIIGSVAFQQEQVDLLGSLNTPLVVINNQSPHTFHHSVSHDDVFGACQVTRHLLDLGHRTICFMGNDRTGRINRDRIRGFKQELRAAGIQPDPASILNLHSSEIEDGEQGMARLLGRPQPPSAVFCFNDLMAIGALKLLRNNGYRVPQDISIAGFDNIAYSAYTTPALTTFNQPKKLIGYESATILLDLIHRLRGGDGSDWRTSRLIRGSLLVRESTGKVKVKE